MNEQTRVLIAGIKHMNDCEAEERFYELKDLFVPEVDVSKVVECVKQEYDESFTFTGQITGLYHAISKWIFDNIG